MLATLLAAVAIAAAPPRTFRVDYFHTGNATEERFALDRLVLEPLPFPGRPDRPLDDTNLGKYLFEVRDLATQRLLYSRGFASIYGEWETTEEAKQGEPHLLRVAALPGARRAGAGGREEARRRAAPSARSGRSSWTRRDRFVDDARPPSPGPVVELLQERRPGRRSSTCSSSATATPPRSARKFEKDARRLVEVALRARAVQGRAARLQRVGALPARRRSAASRARSPASTGARASARPTTPSARSATSSPSRTARCATWPSFAPYDALAILVNAETYGGGGIFNLYTTVAADSRWASYIFVHELGHSLAALADEYFTSDTAYLPPQERLEPWEPNVTVDPRAAKWKDLLTPGAPLPTPWPKDEFTAPRARSSRSSARRSARENRPEAEMDALFLAQQKEETALLSAAPHAAQGGRVRGGELRGERLLPAADRLRDVHPRTRCRSARCAGGRCPR